jgi:two-component sensor histidine kinase
MLGMTGRHRGGRAFQPSDRSGSRQSKMQTEVAPTTPSRARRAILLVLPPDLTTDLDADNALLRAALARSEDAGVRQDLVARELQHRMGNLLAVVQAIARQTFRLADPESRDTFSARLRALAAAQKLLIDSETRITSIREVVMEGLAPHCSEGDRARISGPEVALDGLRAHALTLALHELATNAAKYGALSVARGWIEVTWTDAEGHLDFSWREHDGPPVNTPARRGFGSMLVSRNLASAFGGEVDLAFNAGGVTCRLHAASIPAGDTNNTGDET